MKELKNNQEIKANSVLLIDEEGKSRGIVSRDQALFLAYDADLDLVEVNSSTNPPVTKIMDYSKYRYNQKKQESRQKSKAKGPEIKEIRLSLKISPHDLNFKIRQAEKFLNLGDKVKINVKLVGREMMYKGKAETIIENFRQTVGAEYENPIENMGNQFFAILERKNETKKR